MGINYNKKTKEHPCLIERYEKTRKQKCSDIIEIIIMVLIFSLLAFAAINIDFKIYLTVAVLLGVLLGVRYPRNKNLAFFWKVNIAFGGNFLAYVLVKFFKGCRFHGDIEDGMYIIYMLILVVNGIVLWLKKRKDMQIQGEQEQQDEELFRERTFDIQRLEDYLQSFSIVGINGPWGSGKSFLVDHLDKNSWIAVKIDLLACNLDEIQTVLLNELDRTLKSEGIFSAYSPKLKKILKKDGLISDIGQIFLRDDTTYSEALTGFADDLKKLPKPLMIIFEDLDRIDRPDVIRKILGISEKLAKENIKVIYQYDEKNLLEKDGFDRKYLEKYIPAVVNLTEISFSDLLDHVFGETEKTEVLKREDFKFLERPVYPPVSFGWKFVPKPFILQIPDVTARKVEHFFKELQIFMKQENTIYQDYKREVIVFFVIKHFFDEVYDKLIPGKSLEETFTFSYSDYNDTITYWWMYCNKEKNNANLADIFFSAENHLSAVMISLFQYEWDIYELKKDFQSAATESVQNIQKKNKNEQIDRIIWNLLCSGKSEYTDQYRIIRLLQEEVLSQKPEEQEKAFEDLWEKLFRGEHWGTEKNDNHTIFKIGVPSMISLFQANRVAGINAEQWIKFLDFYFEYKKVASITAELIECLNYCDLSQRKTFLYVLKKFVSLKVTGNMNHHGAYRIFLDHYLTELSGLGYIDTEEVMLIRQRKTEILDVDEIKDDVIDKLKKKILCLRKKIPLAAIQEEIDLILSFLDKNIELMDKEEKLKVPKGGFKSEIHTRLPHQELVDEIQNRNFDDEEFSQEIEKYYETGKLNLHEIGILCERRNAARGIQKIK